MNTFRNAVGCCTVFLKKIHLHDPCWRVCEPYLFSRDVNAAVLRKVMLMMHTVLFAVQVEQFSSNPVAVSSSSSSACVLFVFFPSLELNTLLETFSHVCKLLSWLEQVYQETFFLIFVGILVG
jgi:hypothetical protein